MHVIGPVSQTTMNDTRPIRILIVEDEPVNRMLIEGLLSDSCLAIRQLVSAQSLQEALAFLAYKDFDIVLLDLNLPDSKELETLHQVTSRSPHTAVIVITGEYGEELGVRAIAGGAQDYLVKAGFGREMLCKSIYYAIERKQMEESRIRAFEELKQNHRELKQMQAQLLQNEKLAAIGQLAAGVAHEINTPVGFVKSNVETLDKYMGKIRQLLDHYHDFVETTAASKDSSLTLKVQAIEQMRQRLNIDFILEDLQSLFLESQEGLGQVADIVQDLRDFARIDQAEAFSDYDLNEGINTTLAVTRNEMDSAIQIHTALGSIPAVPCNASQINQVLHSIVINAVEAIRSQACVDQGLISIETYASEREVVCVIVDDGPGIPSDVLPKVFDPFFTTKSEGKGMGLSLSLAYDIVVNKHCGQLTVESQVGQGTTFILTLPMAVPLEQEQVDKTAEARR